MKISLIGAGSLSFGIGTLKDIYLNDKLCNANLEVSLMDIEENNLNDVYEFSAKLFKDKNIKVSKTLSLTETLMGCDYAVVAIEVDRYKYWSQDFHIPRQFGSTQAYGENGGPGSMFHTLRNIGPIIDIAKEMEKLCPNAWFINYTNPEAKLVQAINHFTNVKCVGLCHGYDMGLDQVARFLNIDKSAIVSTGGGLNHFGWFTKLEHKKTGEDLYPKLREALDNIDYMNDYDHTYLSRLMLDMYGLYPYPGTNHIGEYVKYGQDYYLGNKTQFNYNPIKEDACDDIDFEKRFIYAIDRWSLERTPGEEVNPYANDNLDDIKLSGEVAIPLIEALYFNTELKMNAVNMPNNGALKGLTNESVIETQAEVINGDVVFIPKQLKLPTAVVAMTQLQCNIHQLLIEAYEEQSKTKLLQAILLDPQAPTIYQAKAMIDRMCELQSELLPKLEWK